MSANEATDRVPVLMYHRVGDPRDAAERTYCIEPAKFRAHITALAAGGYHALPIEQFLAWLDGDSAAAGPGSFVLTFDDGFADLHEHVFPLLREVGWSATIFLVAGLIGAEDRWARALGAARPLRPLLSRDQIAAMAAAGFSFHSHSMTHRSLTGLSDAELLDEIAGSRERLKTLLGSGVDLFAYPYGHHDERVVGAVRAAGYRAAFSVQPGFNRRGVDAYRIRRLDVYGGDSPRALMRKLAFGSNDGSLGAACRYYWSRFRSAGKG